eukprot:TRINITY_DN1632_c0_g1_i3.p1 TRINITY_DN1632_c0_g1~~TRINITY_DN1632_c0_g1_i3.p1  ORF type:complete len:638 (-),score=193.96 TRINITY_DN1632_c0_g1_i3:51-1943(-)
MAEQEASTAEEAEAAETVCTVNAMEQIAAPPPPETPAGAPVNDAAAGQVEDEKAETTEESAQGVVLETLDAGTQQSQAEGSAAEEESEVEEEKEAHKESQAGKEAASPHSKIEKHEGDAVGQVEAEGKEVQVEPQEAEEAATLPDDEADTMKEKEETQKLDGEATQVGAKVEKDAQVEPQGDKEATVSPDSFAYKKEKEQAQAQAQGEAESEAAVAALAAEADENQGDGLYEQAERRMRADSQKSRARRVYIADTNTTVTVAIENKCKPKPFLGGYRNRLTGTEYHHASTQTDPRPATEEEIRKHVAQKFHRETQTKGWKCRHYRVKATQSVADDATQMPRRGVFIDESKDYMVVPGRYETSEEWEERHRKAATKIQCAMRQHIARKRLRERQEQRRQYEDTVRLQEEKEREMAAEAKQHDLQRQVKPRSAVDFQLRQRQLDEWKQHELDRINASEMGEQERRQAVVAVVAKYTKHLQRNDRLRVECAPEVRQEKIQRKLKKMSSPKKIGPVLVETPSTKRSQELWQLYNALLLPSMLHDDRIILLDNIVDTTQPFPCALTRDIADLVEREKDLLNRNISDRNLEGLRKRMANLFLQFVENPASNPEAAKFLKTPNNYRANVLPTSTASK